MAILMDHLISSMIVVPFAGIAILAFMRDETSIKRIAFGITIVEFFLSLILWRSFDFTLKSMQFVERLEWMPTFNIQYAVGVDGISIVLVLLTTLLFPICILSKLKSKSFQRIRERKSSTIVIPKAIRLIDVSSRINARIAIPVKGTKTIKLIR